MTAATKFYPCLMLYHSHNHQILLVIYVTGYACYRRKQVCSNFEFLVSEQSCTMTYRVDLRLSMYPIVTFLLISSAVPGSIVAQSSKMSFTNEGRQARVHRYQSAVQDGTLLQRVHPSREQTAARIWSEGARRVLRDISPPGMWPVTDEPPELAHRRALLTAANCNHRMLIDVTEPSSPSGRYLLREMSPSRMRRRTDSPPEFARRRDLLFAGNSQRPKLTRKIVRKSYSSRRTLLRDISPPGMWPVPDPPPEIQELRRRRGLLQFSVLGPGPKVLVQRTVNGVNDDPAHQGDLLNTWELWRHKLQ
ncbi:hypothetical protein MPTK1_8g11600 [Marchantia polymorpha subsp. ruderalis]|uniref:Uncharacterized protein n=1 Tax=Marchantia polymorpha TaxID=3197 RepID=A0A2R6XML9_MARPO|nr:hypothetical protein MARPO_0008s0056 [Marchantia polymorpha]BBN19548.1 hypothetical protein Mp_8g11600 [Marchantia polymorpha subsp. ruderalis]|eukprot:PTQ47276.1 hypothetical protein MARPO_0008s0056 [Marchantia polymorpha]